LHTISVSNRTARCTQTCAPPSPSTPCSSCNTGC
jgi:hypothetical protein